MKDLKCCISEIIPTIYSGTLSYQEMIGKLCLAIKNIGEYVEILGTSLDGEIEKKVDAVVQNLIDSGEFNTIITNAFGNNLTYYNVIEYGAIGDGVTDDTVAITKTINAALKYKKRIFFPPGIYIVSSPIKIYTNTEITAVNATIKLNSGNAIFITSSENLTGKYNDFENIKIDGLNFDGNNFIATCIGIIHAKNILIENCHFINLHGWHFIELNAVTNAVIKNCTFKNYTTKDATEMLQIDGAVNQTTFPWVNSGWDNTPCTNIWIENNTFENRLYSTIVNPNGSYGIGNHTATTAPHENITIKNNIFINLTHGVKFINAKKVTVSENFFKNSGIIKEIQKNSKFLVDSNIYENEHNEAIICVTGYEWVISNNKITQQNKPAITGALTYAEISNNTIQSILSDSTVYLNGCMAVNLKENTLFGANLHDLLIRNDLGDSKILNNVITSLNAIGNKTPIPIIKNNAIKGLFSATNCLVVDNAIGGQYITKTENTINELPKPAINQWTKLFDFPIKKGTNIINIKIISQTENNKFFIIRLTNESNEQNQSYNFNAGVNITASSDSHYIFESTNDGNITAEIFSPISFTSNFSCKITNYHLPF